MHPNISKYYSLKIIRLLALFLVILYLTINWAAKPITLKITVKQNTNLAPLQIYFKQPSTEFSEQSSIRINPNSDGEIYKATIRTKQQNKISAIRIDPTNQKTKIQISEISIDGPGGSYLAKKEEIKNSAINDLSLVNEKEDQLTYAVTGNDPQFLIHIPDNIQKETPTFKAKESFTEILFFAYFWILLELSIKIYRDHSEKLQRQIKEFLKNISKIASDQGTIVFKPASMGILIGTVILAALFVSLKLHQSSIGMWNETQEPIGTLIPIKIGEPKGIRSDEWMVQTPWMLNQAHRGFKKQNTNIGGIDSAFVASTPTLTWTIVLQPKFWGFFFFDIERGFSWFWAFKLFGLIISFFLLFLLLTKGSLLTSVTGTIWIFGTSFTQWWFSSNTPEILTGFALGVVGAIYLMQAQKKGAIIFGGCLVVLSASNLLLTLYPAFIVPLAYLASVIILGAFLQERKNPFLSRHTRFRVKAGAICLIAILGICYTWYVSASETIELIRQTVYPGQRFNTGGGLPFERVWYGFYEAFRISENDVPLMPSNASEAGGFFLLFPILFFLISPQNFVLKENLTVLLLLLFCTFTLTWISTPLPDLLREIIASGGWRLTTPKRATIALGVGSIIAAVIYVSKDEKAISKSNASSKSHHQIIITTTTILMIAILGLWLREIDPKFFNTQRIIIGLTASSLLSVSIIYRHKLLLFISCITISIPTITVNPLTSGLSSITYHPLLSAAYLHSSTNKGRWAVIGNGGFTLAQGLKSRGLDVFNGSSYAPNMQWINLLDPNHESKEVWNRYAHITLTSDPTVDKPAFELISTDQYLIKINVCKSPYLSLLGVTNLAYTTTPSEEDIICLKSLSKNSKYNLNFFSIDPIETK